MGLRIIRWPLTDVQGQRGQTLLEYVGAAAVKIPALDRDIGIRIGNRIFSHVADMALGWSDLDTGAEAIGTDYYVYVCDSGGALVGKWSAASTYPSGFDANNSRKIGMFHNSPDGDILQYSIQDLNNRPKTGFFPGAIISKSLPLWYFIYLPSDDGAGGAQSAYNANYLDTLTWYDAADRGNKIGWRMLWHHEFMDMAAGTPEEEDMGTEQHTTGGHSIPDGSTVRVQSDIGAEDCAGVLRQWGLDQGFRYDGGGHTHTENTEASYTQDAETASTDPLPPWDWYNLPGSKGSIYRQGTYGVTRIAFGGGWDSGAVCGSRCADLHYSPWDTYNDIGVRFACESS